MKNVNNFIGLFLSWRSNIEVSRTKIKNHSGGGVKIEKNLQRKRRKNDF